jgi:FkbM family methyltransferase
MSICGPERRLASRRPTTPGSYALVTSRMTIVRRALALPPLGRLLKLPRVERTVATVLRATTVRESIRFVARELGGRQVASPYRLRESSLIALIRHGTPDVATLDEVFYQRQYQPPPHVSDRLGRAPQVVDLGANIGLFGLLVMAGHPSAHVIAVEADAANADVLRRTRDLNKLDWEIVEAVAATQPGTAPFAGGLFSLSRVEDSPDLPRVQAVDAFAYLVDADLAKIDIEGSEWELLSSRRLSKEGPRALVLEYHPHLAPDGDPSQVAVRLLEEAGYSAGELRPTAPGHGIVWAWR